jgi:hypothetical protein
VPCVRAVVILLQFAIVSLEYPYFVLTEVHILMIWFSAFCIILVWEIEKWCWA